MWLYTVTTTECDTMRSQHFPLDQWVSKWQSCDLIIPHLASEPKCLIICSTNLNIAKTAAIATVCKALFMPVLGVKKKILIPENNSRNILKSVLFCHFQERTWWLRDLNLFDVGHITSEKQSQVCLSIKNDSLSTWRKLRSWSYLYHWVWT